MSLIIKSTVRKINIKDGDSTMQIKPSIRKLVINTSKIGPAGPAGALNQNALDRITTLENADYVPRPEIGDVNFDYVNYIDTILT